MTPITAYIAEVKEMLSFYAWRIKILQCKFKHDWQVAYTRVCVGGDRDGEYSGKLECTRCFAEDYFAGHSPKSKRF